ncbi:hypothetical protein [Caldimonas tepidiphila]|uniref:hypothetical protein n=1 Tax=Caldimonas tepidiphila TaxID=2315841 RepID=UPI00130054B8|nr:hypothetical protein [Caldimonas tepidiphila]
MADSLRPEGRARWIDRVGASKAQRNRSSMPGVEGIRPLESAWRERGGQIYLSAVVFANLRPSTGYERVEMDAVAGFLADITGIPRYVLEAELPGLSLYVLGLCLVLYLVGRLLRSK